MGYAGPYSLSARVGAEIVGSIMVYLLGVGVVANALLPKTKGQGMGFLAIAIAAGLGILIPIIVFQQVSGWFNPSFLIALWVRGQLSAADFFALLAADLVGYFVGALLLWLYYLPHFNCAVDPPACSEVERLLTDPALLTQPALLNASYGLGLPRITSPRGLWSFFLGELQQEVSRVTHAQRLEDPLDRCASELRGVHAGPSPPRTAKPAAPGPQQAQHAQHAHQQQQQRASCDVESAATAGAGFGSASSLPRSASASKLPSEEGEGEGGSWGCALPAGMRSLASQLRREGDPRLRVVLALTKARQDVVLSVFATRPAVFSPLLNLIQEFMATGLLVTLCLMVIEQVAFLRGDIPSLWASQSALYACCTQTLVILGLGGPTGPAMNAARDLAPRLAHHLLPIPGKGCSEWWYGWVPFVGTLAGGAAAGALVDALVRLLRLD